MEDLLIQIKIMCTLEWRVKCVIVGSLYNKRQLFSWIMKFKLKDKVG